MFATGSCDDEEKSWGGEDGGIAGVTVLAGGVTDTVTISGGEEDVTVSMAGGGGGGGVGCGVTLSEVVGGVLSPLPPKPSTMLLIPLTPSHMIPSRSSQKPGLSDMFSALVDSRMGSRRGVY